MAIEFRQKLKFFKISHNHGQNLVETIGQNWNFWKQVSFGYSFNKIYFLRVENFKLSESWNYVISYQKKHKISHFSISESPETVIQ